MSKSAYENCPNSGEGKFKIDAAIRERSQIEKILTHHGLDSQAPLQRATQCTLAWLPHAYCQVGRKLQIQYFADVYPVRVEAVGYRPLHDPENAKPRS